MPKRIVAAWKVLRGEWIAHSPTQLPPTWIYSTHPTTYSTTATQATVTLAAPKDFDPQAAGRRAVRRHGGALRRLAGY